MRITAAAIQEVRRLWNLNTWSQRQIAQALGISRASVRNIILGRVKEPKPTPAEDESTWFDPDQGVPERCAGCGGLVFMPCHLCRIRKLKATQTVPIVARRRADRRRAA